MKATILLGGNMGNRLAYLKFALFHIAKDIGIVEKASSVYETEAWGSTADKAFLNQIAMIDTKLGPKELLQSLLLIEKKAGRTRKLKWANRTLDLDILFCGNQIVREPNLTVPHPEIQNRRFVLTPLVEMNQDFIHPVLKLKAAELLERCTDKLIVKKHKKRGE